MDFVIAGFENYKDCWLAVLADTVKPVVDFALAGWGQSMIAAVAAADIMGFVVGRFAPVAVPRMGWLRKYNQRLH